MTIFHMNEKDYNKILCYLDECERNETYGQRSYKGDIDNLDWNDIEEYCGSYGIRDEDCIYIHNLEDIKQYIYKKV